MTVSIIGEKKPKIGSTVTYTLSLGINTNLTVAKKWAVYGDTGLVVEKSEGTFCFQQNALGKTYIIKVFCLELVTQKETEYSMAVEPIPGDPKIVSIWWEDCNYNKLGGKEAQVAYLDPIFLVIQTANIPRGEQLEITVYEDEYVSGHGDSSVKMEDVLYAIVKKSGKAELELSTTILKKFMDKANANDLLWNDSVHDYYVQIKYKNKIDIIIDKTQVKVKNKVERLIKPINGERFVTLDEEETHKCYCMEQGIVSASCEGKGTKITDEHYKKLAEELGVEQEVFQAVAIVESGGRESFKTIDGEQRSKILFERHYMYRISQEEEGMSKEDAEKNMKENPEIFNEVSVYKDSNAKYGTEVEQYEKLSKAKKINENAAIQSCSWGKFQVMGDYYDKLYETPQDLEKAMNMCELQHYAYFKTYLKEIGGTSMINAMKNKDWATIARLYNGSGYKKNNYDVKMKNAYNELKK